MRDLSVVDAILVVFCGGLGMVWAMVALFAAMSLNMPPPALDPVGLLRGAVESPLLATSLAGYALARAGLSIDYLFLNVVVGIVAGVICGLLLTVLSRRWSW